MTARQVIGVVLIALGVLSLIWGGISWTREKTLIDIGPIHAQTEERKTIPIPPILGVVAVAGGTALLVVRRRV